MTQILTRGAGSRIVAELKKSATIVPIDRDEEIPTDGERYLFCAGLVRQKPIEEQTEEEIAEGWRVNFWQVWEDCEQILSENDNARICVIGSESAYNRKAFDRVYSAAKARLHKYIEQKILRPGQQLVCISPGVIEDCGMALRHSNPERQAARRLKHPQRRFLRAVEVARLIDFVLLRDDGYLNNVVIRMNGGEHTTGD